MNISSTFKNQQAFGDCRVVLDVKTPMGDFHVGMGVGSIEGRQPFLTPVGQAAMRRLNEMTGAAAQHLRMINVKSSLKAKTVVPQELRKAKSGDSLFFFCKNPQVYDTVFAMLNVDTTRVSPAPVSSFPVPEPT
ncbi:hypothetical protein A9R05_43170 (plasmid) [Burkholderia sp. KK1]|uniref:hypothetical protein n=1 Tax=Burkholderia sp. M701 TaxID=326454 RepID=UPI0009799F28|nr:hypothetical protein [Burkholderia sp. M701]AQH05818.1 hypothetical protein A9R05_43170 [Burkholderia sp. KK1]